MWACSCFSVFSFWLCSKACGILVPRSGIEPASLALEGRFLTTGLPGMSTVGLFQTCSVLVKLWPCAWALRAMKTKLWGPLWRYRGLQGAILQLPKNWGGFNGPSTPLTPSEMLSKIWRGSSCCRKWQRTHRICELTCVLRCFFIFSSPKAKYY